MNSAKTIAVCVECSNSRGMGHLFRALLYIDYLRDHDCSFVFLINEDKAAIAILKERNIDHIIVDFNDLRSDWEKKIIEKYDVDCWFNDKYETSYEMGSHIKKTGIQFCVIDDVGEGERFADISFAGMLLPTKRNYLCENVKRGIDYIVLNPEIALYRWERDHIDRILVSLGGSDTYGATVGVVKSLVRLGISADIHIGPDFAYTDELLAVNTKSFRVIQNVPSMIGLFEEYDFAITGGGVTCCEAMASGLPCAVIANEEHEINTARFFEGKGCCIFLGKHDDWDETKLLNIKEPDLEKMSRSGIELFKLDAVDRIFGHIMKI